ncbi:DgyrCDS10593 [Dimorphilus gyrociliatus]|uniref:DgyrCDS10593 n=1 Tax=Dimorphilus gyrociliatus TaxID=2664684 RepID=A0A7I8W5S0_9ANNE|nr:DgyrCDS10593 [Dimorphilus gyrociliatus]
MEKKYCAKHTSLLCLQIVTSNKEKSKPSLHYVCSDKKCDFSMPSNEPFHDCPKHPGRRVLLKKYVTVDDKQILRFQCSLGRANEIWCGLFPGDRVKFNYYKEKGSNPGSVQDKMSEVKVIESDLSERKNNGAGIILLNSNEAPKADTFMKTIQSHGQYYNGRMNAEKLTTIRKVTNDALMSLHNQLELCPKAEDFCSEPEGLKHSLMSHQKQAIAWMRWREKQMPSGGILADDMGLGKTLTVIALVLKDLQKRQKKETKTYSPTLVVCPASVVHQWNTEINNHVVPKNRPSVIIYHGASRERQIDILSQADIVLTTYSLVGRCSSDTKSQGNLSDIEWRRIVLDEGHVIRNYKTESAKGVCNLTAKYRWILTGTPIQNNLVDMYSLLKFLRFSPFDEYELWKRQVQNYGTKRLNVIVKAILLRRTKQQTDNNGQPLVNLPEKTIKIHKLTLSERERKIYDHIFQKSKSSLMDYLGIREQRELDANMKSKTKLEKSAEKENLAADMKLPSELPDTKKEVINTTQFSSRQAGTQILTLLLRLRQSCCHGNLLSNKLEENPSEDVELDIVAQMQHLSVKDQKKTDDNFVSSNGIPTMSERSSKIDALMNHIEDIRRKNERCVVVSQWTSMLLIVEQHLKKDQIKYATINGSVPPKERSVIVDLFNAERGAEVLLLSLQAGGVGLNLIGANHLFLMDIHWNPALEAQAADRIYRVGQKRNVFIHRFFCENTVEERISRLQEQKKKLAENVLSGTKTVSQKLTMRDLRMLFGLSEGEMPRIPLLSNQQNQTALKAQ